MAITKEIYEINKCIYSSKNYVIYEATNTLDNKPVIVKTINVEIFDLSILARLKNEYNLISKIKSNFVVKVIDYIKIKDNFYIVMEYCEGIPLSEYIIKHKISIKEFLYVAIKIVEGLRDIHKNGIIHKDINPSNIIYDPKNRKVKIIDFGIATEFSFEKPQELNLNSFDGTLYYISPEQTGRMNRSIDFRTDFYSLGVTFYEMLCGSHPFESESPTEIIFSHIAKTPPSAIESNIKVPVMLSKIISKLLSKMPEDRYANADGILYDLNKCLHMITNEGKIQEFDIGMGDYSDRFEIPKKLYGRESEISSLNEIYGNVVNNGKSLIAIGGYSGVGKTHLVNELHKPIVNSRGIFISGKFDQYQRNVPYYAFFKAINMFCDYILSESENSIKNWKSRLGIALQKDGNLLVDKVPRLALLVGEQPKLINLSPLEERTKFKIVIQNFLMTIASERHPLVMFIDDIHLADKGSLEIIEDIMGNDRIRGLLIVACYRDNEVDNEHSLIHSLRKIENSSENVKRMSLGGLNFTSVVEMIEDTIHCCKSECSKLAEIVYKKTNGNPFYIKQFLKFCYENGFIYFDLKHKTWQYDIAEVQNCPAEENVIEFLLRNMDQLSSETQKLLSFGACIGQRFGMKMLTNISGKDKDVILSVLKSAVKLEIIYPFQNKEGEKIETEFHFSHDRFQQAFYTILSEKERSNIHYNIAKYYENTRIEKSNNAEELFFIADNYCKAISLIDSEFEKRRVEGILQKAAHSASLLSAYDTAVRFLEQIICGFSDNNKIDRDFIFSVYSQYHEALYSLVRYDKADEIYKLLEKLADEPIVLTGSCCLQAISLSNHGRYGDAFMLGIELLEKLGVHYPYSDLEHVINKEIDEYYDQLSKGNFMGIEEEAKDAKEHAIGKLLNRITAAGFFYNPMCSFWAIITNAKRILKNGYTPGGLQIYASLIMLLAPFKNDYRLAYSAARKAMKLAEKKQYKNELFRVYHVFSLFNCHWFKDVRNSIPYARESFRGNVEVGDFEFACFSYFTTQQAILETCKSVSEIHDETDAAIAFANKTDNRHALGTYISYKQLCKAIKGETLLEGSFDDENFKEQNHIEEFSGNLMALCYFYILRALSAVIYCDYDTAFILTEKSVPLIPSITGFYPVALHNFLHSLSMCKRIENNNCTGDEKHSLLEKIKLNQKWLNDRANDAPVNFSHLYDTIKAEIAIIEGESLEAVMSYEKAADKAKNNKRYYHYALICELTAMYRIKLNIKRAATVYLKESYLAFLSWGAKGKTEQMKQKYRDILFSETFISMYDNNLINTHSLTLSHTDSVDLNSVIKASQAISSEIEIESILEKLIYVLLENSGAQNIYFLTKKDFCYEILGEGHSVDGIVKILQGCVTNMNCIPTKIIDYVARTHEIVILDNAVDSLEYGNDEYIRAHKCKSVMSMPVLSKGELKGVLYFENNLVEGAFSKNHVVILKAIASQLAISLENAYLYNNLRELVEEKTRELREEINERKKAENLLSEMANHDHLTNLTNRRMFKDILKYSIITAKQNENKICVLFVDLDGFKAINDKYGHDKGDVVLVTVAKRLSEAVRSCDTVSRMGGDEFVMILQNVNSVSEIKEICHRIVMSVGKTIILDEDETEATVTNSIGISIFPYDGETVEELICNADKAMYIAKKNGRNQFVFYSEKYEM